MLMLLIKLNQMILLSYIDDMLFVKFQKLELLIIIVIRLLVIFLLWNNERIHMYEKLIVEENMIDLYGLFFNSVGIFSQEGFPICLSSGSCKRIIHLVMMT